MPCRNLHPLRCLQPGHAVVALTLAVWFPAAVANERGVSATGMAYASGGVSHCELQELQELQELHERRED